MQELARFLERAKCKLALAVDFNLGDLFRMFIIGDTNSSKLLKDFIDCSDVTKVARYLGVMPTLPNSDESHNLIKSFVR